MREFIADNWSAVLLLGLAVALPLAPAVRRRRVPSVAVLLTSASLGVAGVGGLALPVDWGVWTAASAAAVLFVMLLVLVTTGRWYAPLAYAVGAVLLVGLGSMAAGPVGEGLVEAVHTLRHLEALQPWWLLLLLLIPVVILLSYRSLAGLGPVRRWLAIGLRCTLIALLTLALAEVRIRHTNENLTVLFLVDRSLSIP